MIPECRVTRNVALQMVMVLAVFLACAVSPVLAQGTPQSLASEFAAVKAQAKAALRSPSGEYEIKKVQDLEAIRKHLANIRDGAQTVAESGTIDSRLVEARIKALGPPPEEGKTEPAYISDRRDVLAKDQAIAMEPLQAYKEMQFEAAALVMALDQRIHLLNNRHMFSRAYSPLDPRLWGKVASDLSTRPVTSAGRAGAVHLQRPGIMGWSLRVAGALAIFTAFLALHQLIWSRIRQRIERAIVASTSVSRRLLLILLDDAAAAVLFGFLLIVATVLSLLLFLGVVNQDFLFTLGVTVVLAGLVVAVAHWLGRSVLLSPIPELRLISLPVDAAAKAFRVIQGLGGVLGAELIFELLEEIGLVPLSLANLFSTLIIVAGSALIWRLANLIKIPGKNTSRETADSQGAIDFSGTISRMIKALALVATATALFGYMALARDVFSGVLFSLGVIAVSIYAHRTIKLVSETLTRGPLAHFQKILRFVPLMAGFVLLLLALFLIALVWGYRLQEISDAVTMLRTGVDFGDVRISAGDVFTFGLVFVVGYMVTRWVQRFMRQSLLPQFSVELGAQAAIVTGIGYFGVLLAATIAIASTGLDLTSLAFVFGALSVGIGFGLQSVVENFTSGVVLLVERPVRVGDWIEVGENSGVVRRIAVRSTQIETWDRHQIIIPNSQLISGAVKNLSFTGGPARVLVPIGVSYDSDVDRVKSVLLEIARAHELTLTHPEPFVTLDKFGDNSIDLKLFAFIDDVRMGAGVRSDLNFEIARRFAAEGIEIPFPQRDLHIRRGLPHAPEPPEQGVHGTAKA